MGEKAQKSLDAEMGVTKDLVVRALAEFNKWHGVEAVAEFVKLEGASIVIELSGPFCRTCGFQDYPDDLKLEIEKVLGKSLEIVQINPGNAESFTITYMIKPTTSLK